MKKYPNDRTDLTYDIWGEIARKMGICEYKQTNPWNEHNDPNKTAKDIENEIRQREIKAFLLKNLRKNDYYI